MIDLLYFYPEDGIMCNQYSVLSDSGEIKKGDYNEQ